MDERFFEKFIPHLGCSYISKQQSNNSNVLKFVGGLDLGVLYQQFYIVVFLNQEKITLEEMLFVRNEMSKNIDKGLIIANAIITREAKKNSRKKNEVPIDFIDYNELKKRTNEFEH